MSRISRLPLLLTLTALASSPAAAQRVDSVPVTHSFRAALQSGTRSVTGAPGPRYWQQRVSYSIRAELDPESTLLRGGERVVYWNNSPDTLRSVVLNLNQNIYAPGVPRNRFAPITGGITLDRVSAQGQEIAASERVSIGRDPSAGTAAGYVVAGTNGRIVLPRPLAPGDSAVLEAQWHFKVPPAPTFRTAWEDALGSRVLQVAHWYPQIAVYDDVHGWDVTPYLGDGEFYLEYGDFDVSLTLPAGWVVGATGTLRNPEEVLTPTERERLARALSSDSVVAVVSAADLSAGTATAGTAGGKLTWHFSADSVRDFAFATSNGYHWDATHARVGDRDVLVSAFYRTGAPNWDQAARFARHAIEFHSSTIVPYLYPQATVTEGPIGGMEYPMVVFIGRPSRAPSLYSVITHELGHEWFPMMVGSDEARYAWMDEGVNTYEEAEAFQDFYPGENGFSGDLRSYLRVAGSDEEVPLMRNTDLVSPYGARTVAAYTKPGVVLRALRGVVGDSVFDRAMRTYAREWTLKHPKPWDFFHTFERVSGRDLDWFFQPWFFTTGVLDQAIAGVTGASSGTATVTVRDEGDNPMPTTVAGITAAGDTVTARIPVQAWLSGAREQKVTLRASAPIIRVVLDPEGLYPDVDPADGVWAAQ